MTRDDVSWSVRILTQSSSYYQLIPRVISDSHYFGYCPNVIARDLDSVLTPWDRIWNGVGEGCSASYHLSLVGEQGHSIRIQNSHRYPHILKVRISLTHSHRGLSKIVNNVDFNKSSVIRSVNDLV